MVKIQEKEDIMAVPLRASEVIQFAIRIEENGEAFYRQMAEKIKTKDIKDLFNRLANEEVSHRDIFQHMVSKIEQYEPMETYPGEYFAYLRAYADGHVFTKEKKGQLMARKIKTAKEALEFAIRAEIDSILYYMEAKNLVPEDQKGIIDKVIEEERKHYLKLVKMKEK
jgi:rubrerythrin